MTPRSTGHARWLPGFVLLMGLLSIAPALAVETDTGIISGRVHGGDGAAFSSVVVEGTRLGAQTDEFGNFTIRGVPVGRVTLVWKQVGFEPLQQTVEVRAGKTTPVDFRLTSPYSIRDSLERAGKWPPPLDEGLARALRSCTAVRAQRLSDSVTTGSLGIHISGVPKGVPRECPLAWRDSLALALGRADFGSPVIGIKHECICSPEVEVLLSGGTEDVRVQFCFFCGEVGIRSDTRSQSAFFGEGAHGFVRFVHAVFFDDPELMEVVDHAYSTHGYR